MDDEPAYPWWGYCFHTGCRVGEYWYCQEEGCRYCGWPVPMEVYDATGYNGDYVNAGSVASGENDSNVTARYGRGRQDGYQPGNQAGQDLYQDGTRQPETSWHNANAQYRDQEHDGQYNDQHNADRSGDYHHNDHQPPNPPSNAWATMGSRSSAGQTSPPASTATLDIEASSTAGNADRDGARWDVVEQTAVHMNAWGDQDIYIQAVGQFVDSPPGDRDGGAPYQGAPYPHELSLSDGSEFIVEQSSVEQSSVEQSSVERPVPGRR